MLILVCSESILSWLFRKMKLFNKVWFHRNMLPPRRILALGLHWTLTMSSSGIEIWKWQHRDVSTPCDFQMNFEFFLSIWKASVCLEWTSTTYRNFTCITDTHISGYFWWFLQSSFFTHFDDDNGYNLFIAFYVGRLTEVCHVLAAVDDTDCRAACWSAFIEMRIFLDTFGAFTIIVLYSFRQWQWLYSFHHAGRLSDVWWQFFITLLLYCIFDALVTVNHNDYTLIRVFLGDTAVSGGKQVQRCLFHTSWKLIFLTVFIICSCRRWQWLYSIHRILRWSTCTRISTCDCSSSLTVFLHFTLCLIRCAGCCEPWRLHTVC